jgi:hypothetical protein
MLERSPAYMLSPTILVKVNSIDTIKNKVKVSQLDIDDHGSVIPLKKASERPRRKPLNMAIATSAVLLIAKTARNNPQERSNI